MFKAPLKVILLIAIAAAAGILIYQQTRIADLRAEDLARLKDTLQRYDELFMNPAPADMKPVFAVLKERLKNRIADLEAGK